jgi:acyl-CoA reductase-like NAD-dependent aldehyde dehydrogenase
MSAPLRARLAWAGNFRRLLAANEPRLAELAELEIAKPRVELLTADIAPLLAACKFVEKNAGWILSPRRLASGGPMRGTPWWMGSCKLWEQREPLGHVAIIATWNYPVGLLGVQLVQALVAGNCVTVKPSERCPKTQSLLLDLAEAAGLPAGVLERTAASREAGNQLLQSGGGERGFDHVIFTGSTDVGRQIASRLAETLTPATLELSGRDSAFVLDDADPVKAAQAIWAAVCMNAGQTCMGPRRALVHEAVYDAFVIELGKLARLSLARTLIDDVSATKCHELVHAAITAGGRDAAGRGIGHGSSPMTPPLAPPTGRVWTPTAVVDCPRIAALVDGRHFGPALAVVKVRSLADALEVHDACDQVLATSIFTKDTKRATALASKVRSTTVTINDVIFSTAHPAAGIGGRGASGMGVSRGIEGLLAMTRPVFVSTSNAKIRLAGKAYSRFAVSWLARMMRWWYGGKLRTVELPGAVIGVAGSNANDTPTNSGGTPPGSSGREYERNDAIPLAEDAQSQSAGPKGSDLNHSGSKGSGSISNSASHSTAHVPTLVEGGRAAADVGSGIVPPRSTPSDPWSSATGSVHDPLVNTVRKPVHWSA